MTRNTPSIDADETLSLSRKGLTRRQFTTGAAWAAPVVALAVATPLAAASPTPTPSISIARDSDVTYTGAGDPKDLDGTYGGTVSVLNLPAGEDTGALTYTITIPSGVIVTPGTLPAGWVVVTNSATVLVFSGPSLSDTLPSTDLPGLTFGGTIRGGDQITLVIEAANPGYQFAEDQLGWGDPA